MSFSHRLPVFQMPDGEYGGGGSADYQYYFYLCTHEACTVADDAGAAALACLSNLERKLNDRIRVKYPVVDYEERFREDIHDKLGIGVEDGLADVPMFVVILPKPLDRFDAGIHRFAVFDLEEFLQNGQFNKIGFGMRLSTFRKMIERGEDLFEAMRKAAETPDQTTHWSDLIEAKPGLFGFRVDLKKLYARFAGKTRES